MKAEVEVPAVLWGRSAGWHSLLLLTVTALCAAWLIVDWGLPSFQLQTFKSAAPPMAGFDYSASNDDDNPWQCDHAAEKAVRERGSQMLHGWSDGELLRRAARAEDILEELSNATIESPSTSRILHDLFPRLKCMPRNEGQKPKIAFMFLTSSSLPLAPLWEEFFKGHEALYNIYVHGRPDWLRDVGFGENMGVFWGRVVPSGSTHRADPDIVKAERRLLANALLDDPMNEWFALISEACIPIQSFDYIYRSLNASNTSRIDCGKGFPGSLMPSRWKARGDTVMLPEVPFETFRFGSQWFSLRRRHAAAIIRDRKYWPKFRLPCQRMAACMPDEHYIQTVIDNVDEGSCHGTPTFVSWNGSRGGHPQSFGINETTPSLIQAMKTQHDGRYFFARKFRPEALNTLLNMTDLLFSSSKDVFTNP